MLRFIRLVVLLAPALLLGAGAQAEPAAKQLFGAKQLPSAQRAQAIGFYSKGCLAGGEAMPVDGPHWQAMRLSRNRNWGHPQLVAFVTWLAREAAEKDGWPGLLVGDLSQPRGGPMLSGHASHQIGLDADIWLTPMPSRRLSAREREEMSAVPVVKPGPHEVYENVWTRAHGRLIRRAAMHPSVQRILVAPGIKKRLCEEAGGDRSWLAKVRPYWGHNYHMHVRLFCPDGSPGCKAQRATGSDDGCGGALAWWYSDEPYRPAKPSKPAPKKREMTLAALPSACRGVLAAETRAGTQTALAAFEGHVPPSVLAKARDMRPAAAALVGLPYMPRPRPARP
ncbi:penicillin-insensitive murein endopeptidase [Afifella pfennigii]|uniref:penicillin-insensitive murein endopeptidase n=1 Tax=Afifella pfennigii TaxID=209897 RepID=UPI001FE1DFF0|nr:penicillin-insensitive murein endopeptidase [Afifella pfennigii]